MNQLTKTDAHKIEVTDSDVLGVIFAILFPVGVFIQGGSFIVAPVEERVNQGKQLELMTGVGMLRYWFSFFLFDFATLHLVSVLITGLFAVVALDGFLVDWNSVATLFLILASFGFSAIWLAYLGSLFYSVGSGFGRIIMLYIFTGFVIFLLIVLTSIWEGLDSIVYALSARFLPPFDLVCSIFFFVITMRQNWEYKFNCSPTPSSPCPYLSYLMWSIETDKDTFNVGIGQMCVWSLIVGLLYMSALFLIKCSNCSALDSCSCSCSGSGSGDVVLLRDAREDNDVAAKRSRLNQLVQSGKMFSDAFLAFNLRKSFKSVIAVSNISFGVHPGECFGLLGTNGAGKTTTFRMLTGDLSPSSGNAFLAFNRSRLVGDRSRFLSGLGYCPQFDGIIGVLTGRQMLLLFARLRGVPSDKIKEHTNTLLSQAGLEKSGNVECRNYSGGMKRRLTTAMALAGDPPVILLDEPTVGVDPVARRHFWKIIAVARSSGKSVVLTSHSMEECEAVCSRLGMMVGGKMECTGTVSYLKKKFAQGFNFKIRLSRMLSSNEHAPDPPEIAELLKGVAELFSPCILRDRHQNLVEFHLLNTLLSLKDLFGTAEELKGRFGDLIADYTVSETTLEDVFIQFARRR